MTTAEQNGYSIIKKSWLITTVVSFFITTGISIGVSQNQLANKIDSEQARIIVKEEVGNELKHYFSDSDGKVLQTKLDNLLRQIEELNQRLDKLNK